MKQQCWGETQTSELAQTVVSTVLGKEGVLVKVSGTVPSEVLV